MLLIKPSIEVLHITSETLQLIEIAGRTCYKSEDKITPISAPKFSKMVLKRGHESVIEHAVATVRIICDRGVTHEIVRHRLASYSQESTRYCDYSNGHVTFIIPPWVDLPISVMLDALPDNIPILADALWATAMLQAEKNYKSLRTQGWRAEQARSVLPNSLKTEIVMTANMREWRHFFKLRTAPAAHPQMREIAVPILRDFQNKIPILFDDIHTEHLDIDGEEK